MDYMTYINLLEDVRNENIKLDQVMILVAKIGVNFRFSHLPFPNP